MLFFLSTSWYGCFCQIHLFKIHEKAWEVKTALFNMFFCIVTSVMNKGQILKNKNWKNQIMELIKHFSFKKTNFIDQKSEFLLKARFSGAMGPFRFLSDLDQSLIPQSIPEPDRRFAVILHLWSISVQCYILHVICLGSRALSQIWYFSPQRPIFLHVCVPVSELPSNISTINDMHYEMQDLCS